MVMSWIVSALALSAAVTPNDSARWIGDYGKALEQTREDDRPLLVVLDDSTDPENRLAAELLDPASGAFPLGSYDLCRVDVSTEYGKSVAEVFRATSFPHVAIIDKSGSVILTRVRGPITEASWRSTLARYESGVRRSAQAYTVAKPVVGDAVSTTVGSATYTVPSQAMPTRPYCPSCQLRNR